MLDRTQLPHLIKLLDDDSPWVREQVLDALAAFGDNLEEELVSLPEPMDNHTVHQVKGLLARHLWGGTRLPAVALADDEDDELSGASDTDLEEAHFEPGQIIRHRRYGYRGVVVDVDPECRAGDVWHQSNQSQPERDQPWYHVLVHNSMQVTYAAQSSLEIDPAGDEVIHPYVPYFFSEYRDGFYVRNDQPWPT